MSNSILIWTDAVDCEYTMSEVHTMYMCKFCVFGKPFCLMHDKCGGSLMQRQHMLRKLIFVPNFLVSISFRHVLNHNPNLLKCVLFSVLMPIWLMFRYLSVSQTLGWRLGKKNHGQKKQGISHETLQGLATQPITLSYFCTTCTSSQ